MKYSAYTIVSAADENELINLVSNMFKDGWIPQGGIAVTLSHDSNGDPYFCYFQAMIMPEQ